MPSGDPGGSTGEATVVTCPTCGATAFDGASFCEACGASLPGTPPSPGAPLARAPAAGAHPEPGSDGLDGRMPPDLDAPSGMPPMSGLTPASRPAPCAACGRVVAPDGYCETCGARQVSERDHFEEQPAPWLAGTCDRGIRHERNEDAMALAVLDPGRESRLGVLVVCDGVSSSTDPDVASLAAARAARDLLAASRVGGIGTPEAHASALADRTRKAVQAGQAAVVAVTRDTASATPASCTIVTAVIDVDLLVLGWVGDSRAYWLPDPRNRTAGDASTQVSVAPAVAPGPGEGDTSQGGARVLTVDDSIAAEQMACGVARDVAERGPQAHAITRWLGVDAPEHPAHTLATRLAGPGWVLLCSDGLWNYCSEAVDLAALVAELSVDLAGLAGEQATALPGHGSGHPDPLTLSRALVGWAKERGGHDNITVGLARV